MKKYSSLTSIRCVEMRGRCSFLTSSSNIRKRRSLATQMLFALNLGKGSRVPRWVPSPVQKPASLLAAAPLRVPAAAVVLRPAAKHCELIFIAPLQCEMPSLWSTRLWEGTIKSVETSLLIPPPLCFKYNRGQRR